jgi:hypothetical protein
MDIELQLRGILPLRDPGVAFTDAVMARVGDVPAGQPGDGVVRLAEARARRRSRRILFGTVVAIGAAAAMPTFFLVDGWEAPASEETVALIPPASPPADAVGRMAPAPPSSTPPGDDGSPADCIDPDVLHGLLLQGADRAFRISTEPPAELAGFKAPRQLNWVGSSARGGGMVAQSSAVYRSSLAPEAARTAAVGALAAAGWKLHTVRDSAGSNVFAAENLQGGDTYCREDQPVTVTASALDGVTYVVLAVPRNVDKGAGFRTACDQPPQTIARAESTLDQYLPRLELPRDPATGRPVAAQGMGGGEGGDAKRRMNVSFTLKDSADNVARHFAKQMAEQGWDTDANWSGTGTVGSSWTRRADADTVLQGTLGVSAFDGGRFTVVFHVVRTK